jgi:adenylate kinase family enzyme
MVVFNYANDLQLKEYRKALDNMLNTSDVKNLLIIVNLPKEVDKTKLLPHFLIYYNSPNDYSFMGKLKDVLLQREFEKKFDLLIWIGSTQKKVFNELKNTTFARKVVVNDTNPFFDLVLKSNEENPTDLLSFVTETLDKIERYD